MLGFRKHLILGNLSLLGNPKAIEFLHQFLPTGSIQHPISTDTTEQAIDGVPGLRSMLGQEPEMRDVSRALRSLPPP